MNVLAEKQGKVYGAIAIDVPGDFVSPFPDRLFPCLVWDHEGRFNDDQRAELAEALLRAGCRYTVCGGHDCEAWHDAVDGGFIRQHANDPERVREALHVMTTWHEDECPDDVAFFFVFHMDFDVHEFQHYLVLHVGEGPAKEEVDAAVRRYALVEARC